MNFYRNYFKQLTDLIFSLAGFIIVSPIFLIITILLSIYNMGNPFFTQLRPGKNGRIFRLIKFKTMCDLYDLNGNLLPDKERITNVGRLVRLLSFDELPQLVNVFKGDMSLVGPRPLLVKYLTLYSKSQFRRHEVKPGITGWTQVNGRNSLSWNQKFELDVWYVDHISFALDLKIIGLTIIKVLKREGINASENTTMEPFMGN